MVTEKTFRQTEIGLVPEDWEIDFLNNYTNRIGDGIHSTPTYSNNGEYFFINGNNLSNGRVVIDSNTKTVSKEQFKLHNRNLNDKTILLSINGTIGNISFYRNEPVILGKSACYINLKDSIEKQYVFYILQSLSVQRYFEDNLTGSTIKNLGLGTINNTIIPLPPLAEQEAIAEALSDCDAWIESLEQLIAKKRLLKQGAMQRLLEPGEGWEVKRLGEVGTFFSTNSLSRDDLNYSSGNIFNIHYGDIHTKFKSHFKIENEIVPFINEISVRNKSFNYCKEGDLVIADASENEADIGKAIEITRLNDKQVAVGLHTIHFRPHAQTFTPEYLGHLWQSAFIRSQILKESQGTKVLGISVNRLIEIFIPFPSQDEQTRIAAILSDMDAELEALYNKLGKARQVKRGMMQELLTGRVRLV